MQLALLESINFDMLAVNFLFMIRKEKSLLNSTQPKRSVI